MKNIYLILKELFYVLTASLVIFGVLELFWSNIILGYFNINWVLLAWLINGILLISLSEN